MTTRALTDQDADALFAFYTNLSDEVHALFRPFPDISRPIIKNHLTETVKGSHVSLGLFDDEHIAGHAFVLRVHDKNPIFGIGLNTKYHRKGYGSKIAGQVLAEADRLDASEITLTVLKRNEKAFRIYERLGFIVHGEHTFKLLNDSYFMIRETAKK